ncbi:hypothetical protein G6F31_016108 [Rhizopus arrhizus]|nr:hypothetical protein G6F31_016108 [Rhizopus arrhizus]
MVRCRRACHSQDDRHQKTLIDTREFGDQHDGRQRHAHGGREERRRADDGRAAGDGDFQHQQRGRHPDGQFIAEAQLGGALAVAQQRRQRDGQAADKGEVDERRHGQLPAARGMAPGGRRQPDEAIGRKAEYRARQHRPRDKPRVDRHGGQGVLELGAQAHPGHDGANAAGSQRGGGGGPRESAEQHFQHEERGAQRHVVDGGQASARAAGHDQPLLIGRQAQQRR